MKKLFVLIVWLAIVGCGPIGLSSGPSVEDRGARFLLERYAPSVLQHYRMPDTVGTPADAGEASTKPTIRSWWVRGSFRGMDRPDYAYQLAARSEFPSFALVVLLSGDSGYEPRILHRVDAPVEDSTLLRRFAPTRLHSTDERTGPTADPSRDNKTTSYDELLLRIDGASIIRFYWDPATREFKKDWLSD